MPLSSSTMNTELLKILDKNNAGFVGFGTNAAQVAAKWGDAVNNYAMNVVPPSTTSSAAKAAFIAALIPGVAPGAFMPALISAFTAYATALALGMAPIYVAVPPTSPIVLTPFPATTSTTAASVAASWSSIIDTWFKTGTATPSIGGPTITWL